MRKQELDKLKELADYLNEEIEKANSAGNEEVCTAYTNALFKMLQEFPQLPKKYPDVGALIQAFDVRHFPTRDIKGL